MSSHTKTKTSTDTGTGTKTSAGTSTGTGGRTPLWARVVRSPWTVACVVAAVVVGPSAATASALDRANAAPPHSAPGPGSPRAGQAPEAEPEAFSGAPAAGRRAV